MYSGLIFRAFASFLETSRPIKTDTEIRSPYHLIVINPKFKKVSPGDCIKASSTVSYTHLTLPTTEAV